MALALPVTGAGHRPLPERVCAWAGTITGRPVPKPRMTRRDRWAKRPCVLAYRAWADDARAVVPVAMRLSCTHLSAVVYFPMPRSWSRKKRLAHQGTAHYVKPDWDNIGKAISDALFRKDERICFGAVAKYWDDGRGPRVELSLS